MLAWTNKMEKIFLMLDNILFMSLINGSIYCNN